MEGNIINLKSCLFEEFVQCYQKYLNDQLVSIILFGSHARGSAKETSDYDLFIIAKGLSPRPFQRVLFIREPLQGQFDKRFCIMAKTPEEILTNFSPILLDIGTDGIILFDKNDFFQNLQKKIKKIIRQSGLQRKEENGKLYWEWLNPPRRGWEITWSGYHEL